MQNQVDDNSLGAILRRRRHQLRLTQADVAMRIGCRANYIGYLEAEKRRPSQKLLLKLAEALDLDPQELFLIANPVVRKVVTPENEPASAWQRFKQNKGLHTRHGITPAEIQALERVALLGSVRSERDFLFILQTIRQALEDN